MIVVYPAPAITQPVSVASLPLPANAAQETGGNLALLTELIELQKQANALSLAIVLHLASISGQSIPPAELLDPSSFGALQ